MQVDNLKRGRAHAHTFFALLPSLQAQEPAPHPCADTAERLQDSARGRAQIRLPRQHALIGREHLLPQLRLPADPARGLSCCRKPPQGRTLPCLQRIHPRCLGIELTLIFL